MARRVDYLTGKHDFGKLVAEQFMEGQVMTCLEEAKAERIAVTMTSGHFGSMPVVDEEKHLVGIISEFDLLKALRVGRDLQKVTVGEVMTPKPVFVSEGASADDLMKVLEENHFIRVPVVDGEHRVTGVVSRTDILRGYLQSDTGDVPWWM